MGYDVAEVCGKLVDYVLHMQAHGYNIDPLYFQAEVMDIIEAPFKEENKRAMDAVSEDDDTFKAAIIALRLAGGGYHVARHEGARRIAAFRKRMQDEGKM